VQASSAVSEFPLAQAGLAAALQGDGFVVGLAYLPG
jgi:hypothetical protein